MLLKLNNKHPLILNFSLVHFFFELSRQIPILQEMPRTIFSVAVYPPLIIYFCSASRFGKDLKDFLFPQLSLRRKIFPLNVRFARLFP